jgi:hypothetical protein
LSQGCITFVRCLLIYEIMTTKFLFPHSFRLIGWIIAIPAAVLGIMFIFFNYEVPFLDAKVFSFYTMKGFFGMDPTFFTIEDVNLTPTISGIVFLLGASFIAFSKEKFEDEFIARIRMDSLLWATYINYAVLLFCFFFFYNMGFMYIMVFNMFTILVFFIIRYQFVLHKTSKSLNYEK